MGNMESCCQKRQQKWVHPCIRGEYNLLGQAPAGGKGSPPHPRGILFIPLTTISLHRFTPASAGNISYLSFFGGLLQVHPRIRGEYYFPANWFASIIGSPPHPRGIFIFSHIDINFVRFTPASAGNILNRTTGNTSSQVHPRIRGEY